MRLHSVAYHLPDPEGTAAGRVLHATIEGLLAEGHDVTVQTWWPDEPSTPLPDWCEWTPVPVESVTPASRWDRLVQRVRAGREATALELDPPPGTVVVAEEFLSFLATNRFARTAMTVHNLTGLDNRILSRGGMRDQRNAAAEARAIKQAPLVLASSARVAGSAVGPCTVVPVAYPIPDEPLPVVDEPVACNVADWRWGPNQVALDQLLRAWPEVRDRVPGARLLLAGRGLEDVGAVEGVELLGVVDSSADVLARAAVQAFPCPASTGPKIKVLEALAGGLPVVTTFEGVEGLAPAAREGAVVAPAVSAFGDALAALLADPERRAALGRAGRAGVIEGHSPQVGARARVAACEAAFPDTARR